MHAGEPCGKQGIELLCIVPVKAALLPSVYVGQPLFVAAECLRWSASLHCCRVSTLVSLSSLLPSVYVGQPLFVAASRNHPLLNSAAELVD